MKKIFFFCIAVSSNLYAQPPANSVVPHDLDYYTEDIRNTHLIFTESNLKFARQTAEIELTLQPLFEQMFGYAMDETLNVGLISERNQIANGFSTQYPNNRQINYVGGALLIDYFSSTSWLNTLLYHETAHNYQLNAKASTVSQRLHSVFGNGTFIIPWFIVPNILESSFLLEGNAVLNESWHGNGGRLYSGRFKAATLQQAKAGYLQRERVYNNNLDFLYGSHFYTLGGYYQYFLAQNYGLENTNHYWHALSQYWSWPFFTNSASREAVGVDFDTTFTSWREQMENDAAKLTDVDGDAVANTQFYYPINGNANEIYFIINESGRGFPELVVFDKVSGKIKRTRVSFNAGKVVKLTDGRYATQASDKTSPWRVYQGLFDADALIIEGTQSKIIEGYLHDGSEVYFDVPSSYDQPQLYVGNQFYAQLNSSVFISDNDDLYYFVQGVNKDRTLYKNTTPLFTIKGFYSYVSGVDSKGAIYFIANSKYGSGLFRFSNDKITRAHAADTIFDARLIDDDTALVAVMGSDEYSYKKIELEIIEEAPHEVTLFVESQPYYRSAKPSLNPATTHELTLDHPYHSLAEMNYSATNIFMGNDNEAGFIYDLSVSFADPLTQNALSFFALRNLDEYTLGGASYGNNQYFIQYSLAAYGVIDRPDDNGAIITDERNSGLIANAYLPFVEMGHYYATLRGSYYQDYESNSRKPLSFALDLARDEQYGASLYRNFLLYASPYTASDRGDTSIGSELAFEHSMGNEFYFGLNGQYSRSDADTAIESRGIKLVKSQSIRFADSDPATVVMPGLKNTAYFKSIGKSSVSLKKVFNLSKYYFTFPGSLRRESLYANYNYYQLETFGAGDEQVNEVILGTLLDTLWISKIPIPISLEYIYNDNEKLAEKNNVRLNIGFTF